MYGDWKENVKKFLSDVCKSDGYEANDRNLYDTLMDANIVHEEIIDGHRWWDDIFRVVEIRGRFVGFAACHTTGDRGADEVGWEFDRSSVDFYKPIEVTVIHYVPEYYDTENVKKVLK